MLAGLVPLQHACWAPRRAARSRGLAQAPLRRDRPNDGCEGAAPSPAVNQVPSSPYFRGPLTPESTQVRSADVRSRSLHILWGDGLKARYHWPWLWDNARRQESLSAAARLAYAWEGSPPAIDALGDRLRVRWPDGTSDGYATAWLRSHAYGLQELEDRHGRQSPAAWTRGDLLEHGIPTKSFAADPGAVERLHVLHALNVFGLCVIEGCDRTRGPRRVLEALGLPGFELEGTAERTARAPLYQQDGAYLEAIPGVRALQMLDGGGGAVRCVDAFRVAGDWIDEGDRLTAVLQEVEQPFVWAPSGSQALYQYATLRGVVWSPAHEATSRAPDTIMLAYYQAKSAFSERLERDVYRVSIPWVPGSVLLVNNRRILLAPPEGARWQMCYASADDYLSALRGAWAANGLAAPDDLVLRCGNAGVF